MQFLCIGDSQHICMVLCIVCRYIERGRGEREEEGEERERESGLREGRERICVMHLDFLCLSYTCRHTG